MAPRLRSFLPGKWSRPRVWMDWEWRPKKLHKRPFWLHFWIALFAEVNLSCYIVQWVEVAYTYEHWNVYIEGRLQFKMCNIKWRNLKAFLGVIFRPLTCEVKYNFLAFFRYFEVKTRIIDTCWMLVVCGGECEFHINLKTGNLKKLTAHFRGLKMTSKSDFNYRNLDYTLRYVSEC